MAKLRAWMLGWSGPRFIDSGPALHAGSADPVRLAMRELAQQSPGARTPRLMGAIERCEDVQALWYLRSPLMQAVAAARGETAARIALVDLDVLFRRAWPDAPVSRPLRLG